MQASSNTEAGMNPLLLELLRQPFAKKSSDAHSVDVYDFDSINYVGLRMLDRVVEFETGAHDEKLGARALSVGELLDL